MTVSYALVVVPWIIFGAALAIVCFLVFVPRHSWRRLRRSRRPTTTPGGPAGRALPARRERYLGRVEAGASDDREKSGAATGREDNARESTQAWRP